DASLEALFVDCESSSTCMEAFPDLRIHYRNLVKRLQLVPETVMLTHPRTGSRIETTIDFRTVSDLVRAVLYERTLSALLPFALEQAFHLNYQPLVALAYSFTGDKNTMSIGMTASVLCSEDMRFISANDVQEGQYFLNSLYEGMKSVCEFWPAGDVDESYIDPVHSDVPVLLVSGALDPVTPPKYAELAGDTLTNSKHIILQGVGHGASIHGCMPRVVEAFIEAANHDQPDDSCLQNFVRPPFFTGYAGPVEPGESAP
ncbi:MAG: alpha/beta hydrolase, partial [Pseudomonadales bacterium]|nr:alpha/beta hydrolase [Pseudomonadales bacterium]